MASRPPRLLRALAGATAAALAAVVLLPAAGQAAPKPTLAQVQAQLDALNTQAETAQELLNQTQVDVAAGQRQLAAADGRLSAARASLSGAQSAVGQLAAAAYRGGGVDQSLQLILSSDPAQYLEQAAELQAVAARQDGVLRTAAAAQLGLDQAQRVVAQQLASLRRLHAAAIADYAKVRAAQAAETALLDSLQAAQRQALARAAAQARARAMAQAAADLARAQALAKAQADAAAAAAAARAKAAHATHRKNAGKPVRKTPGVRHNPAPHKSPPGGTTGGSIGARVVAYALSKVGDAYVWGAAGPTAYDCSGLTMRAYQQVGISLPHSSSAQSRMGRAISPADLQPGDLVFYYSPIHHVGIYIGGGEIVNAENPGVGVTITGLYSMPFAGAVRPY